MTQRVFKKDAKEAKGVVEMIWTQGALFDFSAGDVLYDRVISSRETWAETLQRGTRALTVKSAEAAGIESPGSVFFEIMKSSSDGLESESVEKLTRIRFVEFLITGALPK